MVRTSPEASAEQYALAIRTWDAYTAPDPTEIERLAFDGAEALTGLGPMLHRHLQRFPWVGTGLSRMEHLVLKVAAEQPAPWPLLHERAGAYDRPAPFFDFSVRETVLRWVDQEKPLFEVAKPPDQPRARDNRGWHVRLTTLGREVLAGKVNLFDVAPVDRWVGGVHITNDGAGWRYEPESGRLVKA